VTETPTITPTDSLNVFETPNTPTPDPQSIYISNPSEGSLVQGRVIVTGKTDVKGYSLHEVEFIYSDNPAGTWFLLARSNQPVREGELATWDTSAVTDGDYSMRLRVYFTDGSWREVIVQGIQVRNYTSTQTPVPTATSRVVPTPAPAWTFTPTSSPMPTPTPLPANKAELTTQQVLSSIGLGAAVTFLLFALFGVIHRIQSRRLQP
jgi:hypothetical protein